MTACRVCVFLLATLCSTSGGLRDDSVTDVLSQDTVEDPAEVDSPTEPSDQDAAGPQEASPDEQAAEVKEVDSPPQEAATPEDAAQAAEAKAEEGPAEAGGPAAEEAAEAASPGEEEGPVDLSQETAATTLIKQFQLNATKNKYTKKVFLFCRTKDEWMASKTEAEMKNGGKLEYEPGKFKEVKDPFWVCYNPANQEKFKVEKKDANAVRPKKFESTDKLPPFDIRVDWPKTPSYDKFFRARKYLQRGEIYAIKLTKKMEQALTEANNNKDWGGLLTPPASWTSREPLKLAVGSWVRCPYPDCKKVVPMSAKLFFSMYEKVR